MLLNFNFGLSFGIESEVVVVGDALYLGRVLGLNRNRMLWWWVVRLGCSAMVHYFLFERWMLMCCLDCFRGRDRNRVEQTESAEEEERETFELSCLNFEKLVSYQIS